MAAQAGGLSTTLLLIELRSPIVSNKTNLIDQVYKNLCAAVKDLFLRFLSFFIHSIFPPWRVKPCMRHGEIRFIPLRIKKGKMRGWNSKGFKIRSMASTINQRRSFSGVHLRVQVQNEPKEQQVKDPLTGKLKEASSGREHRKKGTGKRFEKENKGDANSSFIYRCKCKRYF